MRKDKQQTGALLGVLLPVGLICVFAFCSLALALLGGQAYRQLHVTIEDSYGSTIVANYLRTKLGQNNVPGTISLRTEEGIQVLIISSGSEGSRYETRIFMYKNALRESYVSAGQAFDATTGVEIAKVSSCYFSISEDGLFEADITSSGGVNTQMALALVKEADHASTV